MPLHPWGKPTWAPVMGGEGQKRGSASSNGENGQSPVSPQTRPKFSPPGREAPAGRSLSHQFRGPVWAPCFCSFLRSPCAGGAPVPQQARALNPALASWGSGAPGPAGPLTLARLHACRPMAPVWPALVGPEVLAGAVPLVEDVPPPGLSPSPLTALPPAGLALPTAPPSGPEGSRRASRDHAATCPCCWSRCPPAGVGARHPPGGAGRAGTPQ